MRRLVVDSGGNVLATFAIIVPVLLMVAGGGIDYAYLTFKEQRLQDAVDAATTAAARQLHVATTKPGQVEAAVKSVLAANLGKDAQALRVTVNVKEDPLALSVSVEQQVDVFFLVDYLRGKISADAVAHIIGGAPICVLGLEDKAKGAITLEKNARMTGNECAVYSNSKKNNSIESKDGALLQAGFICTVGGKIGSEGNFDPEPVTDCPPVEDPLADLPPPPVGACSVTDLRIGVEDKLKVNKKLIEDNIEEETEDESERKKKKNKQKGKIDSASNYDSYTGTLSPGVYCGGLVIGGAANITFEPGIYVIKDGPLYISDFATVEGDHVGFYFNGTKSNLYLGPNTTVSFTAPTDGPMAGLLMFEDRGAPKLRAYAILSDGARILEGTIYLPQSQLYIDADAPIADKSAYTAIISRRIELYSGPHLILNTDYDLTDVPVPVGIANNRKVILSE